jgi:hypothetical protein
MLPPSASVNKQASHRLDRKTGVAEWRPDRAAGTRWPMLAAVFAAARPQRGPELRDLHSCSFDSGGSMLRHRRTQLKARPAVARRRDRTEPR